MTKRHQIILDELDALIEALRQLYFSISSFLLKRRMDLTPFGSGDTSDIDLAAQLHSHIDTLTAKRPSEAGNTEDERIAIPPREMDIPGVALAGTPEKTTATLGRRISNELATWLKRRRGSPALQPHVAEKLKASAEEHINKALMLTRQGKYKAARFHVDLAESALRTAVHYMREDAFRDFKKQVRDRLD